MKTTAKTLIGLVISSIFLYACSSPAELQPIAGNVNQKPGFIPGTSRDLPGWHDLLHRLRRRQNNS